MAAVYRDTEILNLIEKTVFVDALPETNFGYMKEVTQHDKDISLEKLYQQAKNVEDLDGKNFAREHSPNGARVNAVIDGQRKKVCYNVMNTGHCGRQNCPFSHDRAEIMQAALNIVRSQHGDGGRGNGGGGRGVRKVLRYQIFQYEVLGKPHVQS